MGVGGGYCEYPGKKTTMPILSSYAQKKKARYFLDGIPKDFRILEVGCGNGWAGNYLKEGGWEHYVGLDLVPPADIVGDIRNWKNLGIEEESFDVIIVFEVVEHVDCFDSCYDILKLGGQLMATSPMPHMDWLLKWLEAMRLNQKRTGPHDSLVYFKDVSLFKQKRFKTVGFLSQRGVFTK